jgi:hypothetical protein
MDQATGADLALIAGALHDAGALQPDLALQLMRKVRQLKLVSGDTAALAAAIRAFGPAEREAPGGPDDAQTFLSKSLSLLPARTLESPAAVQQLLEAMAQAGWKEGASATKLAVAVCKLPSESLSADVIEQLSRALAALEMPRHLRFALRAHHLRACAP